MVYIPKVPQMPKEKRRVIIQKAGSPKRAFREPKLGASPENSPPLPRNANAIPIRMEQQPKKKITTRHENQIIMASDSNGATTKLKLGASSWVAIVFPQCLTLINEVRVAMPDGR